MAAVFYAHTDSGRSFDQWQELSEHLNEVGELAMCFAPAALQSLAGTAGRWHDLGKYQEKFQTYILRNAEGSNDAIGTPHAIVGAALALERFGETDAGVMLALVVEAHHGALKSPSEVQSAVIGKGARLLEDSRAGGLPSRLEDEHPVYERQGTALAVRMLFSALVDADLLNTEAWDRGYARASVGDPINVLRDRLDLRCRELMAGAEASAGTPREHALAQLRREVYENCIAAGIASGPQQFTLTVPTGGGKTLSGLAFALHHAVRYGKRRVIVVAPFTSILEQTADVYRRALGTENVLEHHSSISPAADTDRNRQAAENWDAPIVVTTSVQLLESLHAAHKRACRKLHRIAESVILLDEVQTFPAGMLKPIHAILRGLVEDFGVTVVHGTATQPLLAGASGEVRLKASEIMPDPAALFAVVRDRFRLETPWDLAEPLDPTVLAAHVREQRQALVITHKRDDARHLAELLGPSCLHLSASMCAAHRSAVIAEVRRRLEAKEPCIVVSTQLIEAGVDIDFPVVYRALAGLETLAQAAGRCNRAMKLSEPGRFIVYRAGAPGLTDDVAVKQSNPPPGTPRFGFQIAEKYFRKGLQDLSNPALFPRFSAEVLRLCDPDRNAVDEAERGLDFPVVAERFRMIDEDPTSIVVPYGEAEKHLKSLRNDGPSREAYRALQRFIVGVRANAFASLFDSGWLEPVMSDDTKEGALWALRGGDGSPYSERFGLVNREADVKLRSLQV